MEAIPGSLKPMWMLWWSKPLLVAVRLCRTGIMNQVHLGYLNPIDGVDPAHRVQSLLHAREEWVLGCSSSASAASSVSSERSSTGLILACVQYRFPKFLSAMEARSRKAATEQGTRVRSWRCLSPRTFSYHKGDCQCLTRRYHFGFADEHHAPWIAHRA